jgi:predicted peroxiredoxin
MAGDKRELVILMSDGGENEMWPIGFNIAHEGTTVGLKVPNLLTSTAVVRSTGRLSTRPKVRSLDQLCGLLHDFVKRGGQLFACAPSIKLRDYDQGDLTEGADIAGFSKKQEHIKADAAMFPF